MYDWKAGPPLSSQIPELELHQRQAISGATAWLEAAIAAGHEPPVMSGGFVASPKNDTAAGLFTAAEEAINLAIEESGLEPDLPRRLELVTLAVRAADQVRRDGFGDLAWQRFLSSLRFPGGVRATPAAEPDLPPVA